LTQNGGFEAKENVKTASEFYDELSSEYADMIELSSRIESEIKVFEKLSLKRMSKSALMRVAV
jgi:hypothetical protein